MQMSIHNEAYLERLLSAKNITLAKLLVYSCDLNPIEMAFGRAKSIARQTPGARSEGQSSVGNIGSFYTNRCHNDQEILPQIVDNFVLGYVILQETISRNGKQI